MAKASSEKKPLEVISPSDQEAFAKAKRELALQFEELEAQRRALQVERNAVIAQKSDLELVRRQLALDREQFIKVTDEIARLARMI